MEALSLSEENNATWKVISSGLSASQDIQSIVRVLEDEESEETTRARLIRVLALLGLLTKSPESAKPRLQHIAWLIGNDYFNLVQMADVTKGSEGNDRLPLTAEAGLVCLHYLVSKFDCRLEHDTLVHATAYTDPSDPWTTTEAALSAKALLKTSLQKSRQDETKYIVDWILPKYLRPIFTKATSKVGHSGRPALFPEQAPRGFQAFEQPAWKKGGLQVISTARWAISNSTEDCIRDNWPMFTPVLLTISEDEDALVRTLGLEIVVEFLEKCPAKILQSTGIDKVFEEAILPSVLYLPSMTPEEESVTIMRPAYEALLVLAQKYPDNSNPARRALLDKVLRDGVFTAYEHASNYLLVVGALMSTTVTVLDTLGIYSVKHLPNLFSFISSVLTDPFTASHASVLLQATGALNAVISNCWPRIVEGGYDGEATRITATCWLNVKDGVPGVPAPQAGVEDLERELQRTQALLRSLREASGMTPSGSIVQILKEEPRLKELLCTS